MTSSQHSRPALLAISHGTSSIEGAAAVADLVSAVASADPSLEVVGGFVDVQQPDLPAVFGGLSSGRESAIVPLLLSAGYHVHVDIAEQTNAQAPGRAVVASALGPDDRLVRVLTRRLREAGLKPGDRVVLAAAGSSDAGAVEDCREMARRLSHSLGCAVRIGFLSAAKPSLSGAVAAVRGVHPLSRVVISSYLLAPGYFADLVHEAGGDVVTEPLLTAEGPVPPEIVELVVDRHEAAAIRLRRAA